MADGEPTPELVAEIEAVYACVQCGFQYPMKWFEQAVLVAPPDWWELPYHRWQPRPFWTNHTLCTRCGRATVRDI